MAISPRAQLLVACGEHNLDVMKDMAKNHGVQVTTPIMGQMLLVQAVKSGDLKTLEYVLTLYKLDYEHRKDDQLLLAACAYWGRTEMAKYAVQVLHITVSSRHLFRPFDFHRSADGAPYLLKEMSVDATADPLKRKGGSMLGMAIASGVLECAQFFYELGCQISVSERMSASALALALMADKNNFELAQWVVTNLMYMTLTQSDFENIVDSGIQSCVGLNTQLRHYVRKHLGLSFDEQCLEGEADCATPPPQLGG